MSLSKAKSKAPPSSITVKSINNIKVIPLKIKEEKDDRPIVGEKLFPTIDSNILIVAPKNSGKTVIVGYIIRNCVGPETSVIVFSSTFAQDKSWKAIRTWMKEHHITSAFYPNIKKDGQDILQQFLDRVRNEAIENDVSDEEVEDAFEKQFEQEDEKVDEAPPEYYNYVDEEPNFKQDLVDSDINHRFGKMFTERSSVKEELPYRAPDYILVFDDIAHELKNKSVINLTKTHRHIKSKTITSTQYLMDFLPEQIRQMDYILLFRGQEDKLPKIKRDAELSISLEDLTKIYKDATKESADYKYGFLYIDVKQEQFRKKFDKMYIIRKNE